MATHYVQITDVGAPLRADEWTPCKHAIHKRMRESGFCNHRATFEPHEVMVYVATDTVWHTDRTMPKTCHGFRMKISPNTGKAVTA